MGHRRLFEGAVQCVPKRTLAVATQQGLWVVRTGWPLGLAPVLASSILEHPLDFDVPMGCPLRHKLKLVSTDASLTFSSVSGGVSHEQGLGAISPQAGVPSWVPVSLLQKGLEQGAVLEPKVSLSASPGRSLLFIFENQLRRTLQFAKINIIRGKWMY